VSDHAAADTRPNIALIGMPGAGKSTVGVLLAKQAGMDFVDTDVLIQVREGRGLQQIVDTEGYERLREVEERCIGALDVTGCVIATGGSAVYSATAMDHLKLRGVAVFLDVPYDVIESRVTNLFTRGIVAPPGTPLRALFDERRPLYLKHADRVVACGSRGHTEVAALVLEAVGSG
jgi:shikimate kinase